MSLASNASFDKIIEESRKHCAVYAHVFACVGAFVFINKYMCICPHQRYIKSGTALLSEWHILTVVIPRLENARFPHKNPI